MFSRLLITCIYEYTVELGFADFISFLVFSPYIENNLNKLTDTYCS